MNLQKVEAKLNAVNELGCRLDDNLDQATKDLYRAEGAVTALKSAVHALENLMKVVDKDLDQGNGEYDLQQMKDIKRYVDRARQQILNLASHAENNRMAQAGKVQGFEVAVAVAKKFKDEEMSRVHLLQAAISQGTILKTEEGFVQTDGGPRPTGVRPGASIKERRKAEEAASVTVAPSEEVEAPKAEPTESQEVVKEESPKPKGKRQKK